MMLGEIKAMFYVCIFLMICILLMTGFGGWVYYIDNVLSCAP